MKILLELVIKLLKIIFIVFWVVYFLGMTFAIYSSLDFILENKYGLIDEAYNNYSTVHFWFE